MNCRLLLTNSIYLRCVTAVRSKHKDTHWSMQVKKKLATGKALEHFDEFYKNVYGQSWNSIRKGLLAEHKYVAVVNNFAESEQIIERLENNGALNVRRLIQLEKQSIENRRQNQQIVQREEISKIIPERQQKQREERLDDNVKIASDSDSITESLKYADMNFSRIIYPNNTDMVSTALYEFIPATKIKGKEDWISETQYYRYCEEETNDNNNTSFQTEMVQIEKETELHFPDHLNVYCFEASNTNPFDSPRKGVTNVFDYYLLDGASLLPVLALGLKPGARLLDMCCAPGGKTLIALQTLYPDQIVCNDIDHKRLKRTERILHDYLYDVDTRWLSTGRLQLTQLDGVHICADTGFDYVLVDVPCTNDRLSVVEDDNNWFKAGRTKERLQLPETQVALLANAIRLVRVGGTVVYATCSLSPIQNDGVVHMALKHVWENNRMRVTVKDLSEALEPAHCIFKFANANILRYGHLVVPYLPQNYGPMYFCKLQRIT